MKKFKKTIMGLGVIAAVALPISVVVACGSKENANSASSTNSKKGGDSKNSTNSNSGTNSGNNTSSKVHTNIPNKNSNNNHKPDQLAYTQYKIQPYASDLAQNSVALRREQRHFNHVNFFPTRTYLEDGQSIKVVSKSDEPVRVILFLKGDYESIKSNNRPPSGKDKFTLKPHETLTIKSEGASVLYIDNGGNQKPAIIDVYNKKMKQIPYYESGKTNTDEFVKNLRKSNSPLAQITSKYFNLTWDRKKMLDVFDKEKNPNLFKDAVKRWDEIAEVYARKRGLNPNSTGAAKRYVHRINLETTAHMSVSGAAAFATNWYVQFRSTTGEVLLTEKKLYEKWGIMHEIGHMWQTTNFTQKGWGETTNNILITLAQKDFTKNTYNIFTTKRKESFLKKTGDAFKANQIPSGMGAFDGDYAMLMINQLEQGFGKNFFPTLNQYYRTHFNNRQIPDTEKSSKLVEIASKITNRNLAPFFEKWGMPFDAKTKTMVQKFPKMKTEIWRNFLYGNKITNPIVEYILPKYNPISLDENKIPKSVTANFGETVGDIIKRIKATLNIPAKYEVEAVTDKNTRQKDVEYDISFNVYDPNNRYATENRFFIKLNKATLAPNTTMGIGEWWKFGYKNRLRLHFTQSANKLFFDGAENEKVIENANENMKISVMSKTNTLVNEINIDNSLTIKELKAKFHLESGIHLEEGMRIVLDKTNYKRYVFLLSGVNAGKEINDSIITFVVKNGIFVKE